VFAGGYDMGEFLEIWVIADVRQLAGAEESFKDPGHVDIDERVGFVETKEKHGIGDVLADTGKSLDAVAAWGEAASAGGNSCGERFETWSPLPGETDGLEERLNLLGGRRCQALPGGKASDECGPECCNRFGLGALKEDFGNNLAIGGSAWVTPWKMALVCAPPREEGRTKGPDAVRSYTAVAAPKTLLEALHCGGSCGPCPR
jgi:hypothetical protein